VNARFYLPEAVGGGQVSVLPDDEAQHLITVLRLKAGSPIRVFDGRGHEFEAVVDRVGKSEVLVLVGRQEEPTSPEARTSVTLVQAVLKGDKMDDVIRDAVMMGVSTIQPVVTERSEVALPALIRAHRQERWQKIAISAAKQCGRATVPEVLTPCEFARIPPTLANITLPGPAIMLVEPKVHIIALTLYELDTAPPGQAMLIVGPEGGWAADEIDEASVACQFVTLGGRTLRADAVPIVALSALFTVWREF
jgi:16S rRNA (uracil1498-N3)-methyltransferase